MRWMVSTQRREAVQGWIAKALVLSMSVVPAAAQASVAIAQTAAVAPIALHIEILEGEGALNNIRQRDAREPVVQITDENHKPVSSVAVLFLIHGGKNGATFSGSQTLTVTTNADGIAHAPGLTLGTTPGTFTIAVTATLGTIVATTVIHQSAVLGALGSTAGAGGAAAGGSGAAATVSHTILGMSKLVAITVGSAVVAGVVVGVVQATKSTTSNTTVTLGSGTIGAARPRTSPAR